MQEPPVRLLQEPQAGSSPSSRGRALQFRELRVERPGRPVEPVRGPVRHDGRVGAANPGLGVLALADERKLLQRPHQVAAHALKLTGAVARHAAGPSTRSTMALYDAPLSPN